MSDPTELHAAMRAESCRVEEDATYSAKGHYEAARIWRFWATSIGVIAVVIGAVAGFSGFQDNAELAGALAVVSAAVTGLLTFLKPDDKATQHDKAGSLFNALRVRARVYREVELRADLTDRALRKALLALTEERNALNQASPPVPRRAFERARRGIEAGEARHAIDQPPSPPALPS